MLNVITFRKVCRKKSSLTFAGNLTACDVVGTLCILKMSRTYCVSCFSIQYSQLTLLYGEYTSKNIHPLPRLFSENQTLGSNVCKCGVPCQFNQYDAIISNSLLDTYKIKQEITHSERSKKLLPKHRDALEVSYHVCTVFHRALYENTERLLSQHMRALIASLLISDYQKLPRCPTGKEISAQQFILNDRDQIVAF